MSRETFALTSGAELRFEPGEAGGVLEGYAALWDAVVPGFNEKVLKGAFARTLAEHRSAGTRPVMLYNHNPSHVIGVWTDITEDAKGLKVTGKVLAETEKGPEARALLAAGGITGLSLGFNDRAKRYDKQGVRLLSDLDLPEISLVPFPASPGARVTSYRSHSEIAAFAQAARSLARAIKG